MNNGRVTSGTNPYASMPLIQKQNDKHTVQQSNSMKIQLTYDETNTKIECSKHYAVFLAVLLCLIQIGSWISNIGYFRFEFLYIYDIWCTIYTVCFIAAQYTKKPVYIVPIRIHFSILCIIAAFVAAVILSSAMGVFFGEDYIITFHDKKLGPFHITAAFLGSLSCFIGFGGICIYIAIYHEYLLQLQKQRK